MEERKKLGEWSWRERIVIIDSMLDKILEMVRAEDRELVHMMRYCIEKLEDRYPPLDSDEIVGKAAQPALIKRVVVPDT
jgi:hypothetical protein